MKKRGMIGEQVNWIYVLIAGSLILAFFATLAIRQKGQADSNQAQESLKAIDELMFQPPRSSQLVHFSNIELTISCDTTGITSLKIGNEQALKAEDPVFSPPSIKSNEIIAMTNEWNIPFKASNFIYLTANDTRYVILYRDLESKSIADQISRELPDQANKAVQESTRPIANTNSKRIVIIGAGIAPSAPSWAAKEISLIQITPQTDDMEEGSITFYQAGQPLPAYPYTGKAMMIGAIYSGNRKAFDCSMKRAYQRASMVSLIYSMKASKLEAAQAGIPRCNDKYNTGKIDQIKTLANTDPLAATQILKTIKPEIDQQNRDALLKSCPTIY